MKLADRIIDWAMAREPDRVIGTGYLERWYLIPRNRVLNIYVHRFTGDDDDRALHDHPWVSLSWCLRGRMYEHVKMRQYKHAMVAYCRWIVPGCWTYRSAKHAHRLETFGQTCWTLFITGPGIRRWGFHCPNGWVHWRKFTDESGDGIGKGCD
jgi:hypothetical protein